MTETAERLKSELSQLPAEERAELANFLLHSLDEDDAGPEMDLDSDLAERMAEIKNGKAIGEPAAKVFAELREKHA